MQRGKNFSSSYSDLPISEGWRLSTCAASDNSWTSPVGITSPMRQSYSWRQQDWRHCRISCPSGGRHCFGHVLMLPNSIQMFLHSKLYGYRRTFPLVGSPTSDGDGPLVDRERLGAARSGPTSECLLVTTGTRVSTVATVEWRNGPQGLRDYCDDDPTQHCHIQCARDRWWWQRTIQIFTLLRASEVNCREAFMFHLCDFLTPHI